MTRQQRLRRNWNNYLFDHPILKHSLEYSYSLLFCLASAFVFGFGFTTFVTGIGDNSVTIITGGVSGISQIIKMLFLLMHVQVDPSAVISVSYFLINIPIIVFGFKFIGVRFSIFTLINVGATSLFMNFLSDASFVISISSNPLIKDSTIARALFAGICTGFSSGLAFKGLFSTGGMDVVSYYVSMKTNSSTGKYTMAINVIIVLIYSFLSMVQSGDNWSSAFIIMLYAALYLVVVTLIIDMINVRNKKVRIQIITENVRMSDILIANFPHSATIIDGVGAYSKKEKKVIIMIVSSSEARKVVRLIRDVDNYAFVEVSPLNQVYGKFYLNPVK